MRSCSLLLAGICLLIVALDLEMTQAFRVDCTKFVFAPKCRGVSAKREAAFPADIAFSDRRQRPDNPTSTGDFVVRRSGRPGTSPLLRLRGRPNPSSAQDDLRQAIDRPNYFRTKREIIESLDHLRTKVASGGAGRDDRGHLRTRDTSGGAGREGRGHLRTRDTSGGAGRDDRGGQSSPAWAPRTIRRIFINRPELLDLGQPKQIN